MHRALVRFVSLVLFLPFIFASHVPASHALRGEAPQEAGLEEKITKALRSVAATFGFPSETLPAASAAIGLPAAPDAAQAGLEERVLRHPSGVTAVAFSPDGKTLASGEIRGVIRFWDPAAGKETGSFHAHKGRIRSLVFHPDTAVLATSSEGRNIRFWKVPTGEPIPQRILPGVHANWISTLAFSPDGKILASGSHDKTIKLWNPETGELRRTLEAEMAKVWTVAFSSDGKTLISGHGDGRIRFWDVATGEIRRTLEEAHRGAVRAVAFSPDGKILASAGTDWAIRLWDPVGNSVARLQVESERKKGADYDPEVYSVAFSPDGKIVAAAYQDEKVRLWDVPARKLLATLEGHLEPVLSVAFSPDGKTLASGSDDRTVRLWDIASLRAGLEEQGAGILQFDRVMVPGIGPLEITTRGLDSSGPNAQPTSSWIKMQVVETTLRRGGFLRIKGALDITTRRMTTDGGAREKALHGVVVALLKGSKDPDASLLQPAIQAILNARAVDEAEAVKQLIVSGRVVLKESPSLPRTAIPVSPIVSVREGGAVDPDLLIEITQLLRPLFPIDLPGLSLKDAYEVLGIRRYLEDWRTLDQLSEGRMIRWLTGETVPKEQWDKPLPPLVQRAVNWELSLVPAILVALTTRRPEETLVQVANRFWGAEDFAFRTAQVLQFPASGWSVPSSFFATGLEEGLDYGGGQEVGISGRDAGVSQVGLAEGRSQLGQTPWPRQYLTGPTVGFAGRSSVSSLSAKQQRSGNANREDKPTQAKGPWIKRLSAEEGPDNQRRPGDGGHIRQDRRTSIALFVGDPQHPTIYKSTIVPEAHQRLPASGQEERQAVPRWQANHEEGVQKLHHLSIGLLYAWQIHRPDAQIYREYEMVEGPWSPAQAEEFLTAHPTAILEQHYAQSDLFIVRTVAENEPLGHLANVQKFLQTELVRFANSSDPLTTGLEESSEQEESSDIQEARERARVFQQWAGDRRTIAQIEEDLNAAQAQMEAAQWEEVAQRLSESSDQERLQEASAAYEEAKARIEALQAELRLRRISESASLAETGRPPLRWSPSRRAKPKDSGQASLGSGLEEEPQEIREARGAVHDAQIRLDAAQRKGDEGLARSIQQELWQAQGHLSRLRAEPPAAMANSTVAAEGSIDWDVALLEEDMDLAQARSNLGTPPASQPSSWKAVWRSEAPRTPLQLVFRPENAGLALLLPAEGVEVRIVVASLGQRRMLFKLRPDLAGAFIPGYEYDSIEKAVDSAKGELGPEAVEVQEILARDRTALRLQVEDWLAGYPWEAPALDDTLLDAVLAGTQA